MKYAQYYNSYLDAALKDGALTQRLVWLATRLYFANKLVMETGFGLKWCMKMMDSGMNQYPDEPIKKVYKKVLRAWRDIERGK